MATFEYKALQADGSSTQGRVEAGGRGDAMQILEDRGWTPLRIAEIGGSSAASRHKENGSNGNSGGGFKLPSLKTASGKWGFESKRVPFAALEDFTRSLSSLLTAGVPLSRALTILYKESSNPAAGAKWRELHDTVIDGAPLADRDGEARRRCSHASTSPWWKRARRADFWMSCWRRSPISRRARRNCAPRFTAAHACIPPSC